VIIGKWWRESCTDRTGIAWRDLPERFGPWQTGRHHRFATDGTWDKLLRVIRPRPTLPIGWIGRCRWIPRSCGRTNIRPPRGAVCRDCHNPEAGERDATVREHLIAHLSELIDGSDAWTVRRRDEFVGSLKSKPGLRRYLRRTGTGLLRADQAAVEHEAHLNGKWLLRTCDETLTAQDLTAGYKQLVHIEAGWRDMTAASGCARCCRSSKFPRVA
jgi:hypothetical protein